MAEPDWSDGLGLARASTDGDAVVALRRAGAPEASIATIDGRSFDDLPALLEAARGDVAAIETGATIHVPDERLLSPVGRPRKIICTGLNYLDHVREAGREASPAHPAWFPKWDNALSAPYANIPLPPESDLIDYESELAVVIGSRCRRVAVDDVGSVIFGYTASNDGSVRDWQLHTDQALAGKAWDALTPLGPVVVPAGQLGGAEPDLAITGLFDGEIVQDNRTSQLINGIPELVNYLSTIMTLEPGDVILTGTPSGVGFARSPKKLLRDGSVFEVRIEGIGSIRNLYCDETTMPDVGPRP